MIGKLLILYSDYHGYFIQKINGGVLATGFKTAENAKKYIEDNLDWFNARL
jgi:hypothetical protein